MNFNAFYHALSNKNIYELCFCIYNDLKYKDCWLGYSLNHKLYWLGLVADGSEAYEFKSASELINAKVFYGKSLQDIWNSIDVMSIDGLCLEEWFNYCS